MEFEKREKGGSAFKNAEFLTLATELMGENTSVLARLVEEEPKRELRGLRF